MAGCKGIDTKTTEVKKEVKPTKIYDSFLFYTEDYQDENGLSIGDLSIKKMGDDKIDKISTGVREQDFTYLNEEDKVLFIDNERTLYEYKTGKDKVKIADNVYNYDASKLAEGIITYQNDENDLYLVKNDKDTEKIASNVHQYELIDNDLYYVNNNGQFRMYHIEDRTEMEISSSVESFVVFSKKGNLAYVNDDYFLYYLDKKGGEARKISSETVMGGSIQLIEKSITYLASDSDDGAFNLYTTELAGDLTTEKIVTSINDYWYDNGMIYYLNSDYNLFKKKWKEDSAEKLASDVYFPRHHEKGFFFEDEDGNVYTLTSEGEKKKLASDVSNYTISDDGEIIYQNTNDELFVNDKKITGDLKGYSYLFGNLIYSTSENKLYMMKNLKEDAQMVEKDLSAYHTVYYHNQAVFNNVLDFKDVAGVWKSEDDEFIEITADGMIISITNREKGKFEIDHADKTSFTAFAADSDEYEDYVEITRGSNDTLVFDFGYGEIYLNKSSKSEADEYVVKVQEAADKEEAAETASAYVARFATAVNSGTITYVSNYIAPDSEFYRKQSKYVEDLYERDISEELIDLEVLEVNKVDENTYKVKMFEEFNIYNWDTGEAKNKSFRNIYTLKRIDGEFLITELQVAEE